MQSEIILFGLLSANCFFENIEYYKDKRAKLGLKYSETESIKLCEIHSESVIIRVIFKFDVSLYAILLFI